MVRLLVYIVDMKTKRTKRHSWYSEHNTTTAPCTHNDSLEWIVRCGQYIALVPKNKEA